MAPKTYLHLVRHAQGFHNVSLTNLVIPDPLLTDLGKEQCATLAGSFPYRSKITHLVSSPLRRTLYTTLLSFPTAVAAGHKIIALPELQETSSLPCDTGSYPNLLIKEFGKDGKVDLSRVTEGWNSNDGRWLASSSAIEKRALEARIFLRDLGTSSTEKSEEDIHIVVVTHGGFLHYFTEDWEGNEKFTGTGWSNTEYRSYEFDPELTEGASLVETKESRQRRKGTEHPLSKTEQRQLRMTAESSWAASGYQTPAEKGREEIKL